MRLREYAALRPAVSFFLLGLTLGVLGRTLLWTRGQAADAAAQLREDFRVLVYLRDGVDSARRSVVSEKLRILPGVLSLRSIPPSEGLKAYAQEDPDLLRAAAFLGENPLPDAAELELSESGMNSFADILHAVSAIPETGDILYKPLQLEALMRLRLCERLTTLALSFCAGIWFLFLALRLSPFVFGDLRLRGSWRNPAAASAGCVLGLLLMALALWPAHRSGTASLEVGVWPQILWILLSGLTGLLLPGSSREEHHHREAGKAAALSVMCAILLSSAVPASAAGANSRRKDLERLQEQIEHKKQEARELQERQQRTKKEISEILDEKQKAQRSYLRFSEQRRAASERAERMRREAGLLRNARERDRRLLGQDLRAYALALASSEPRYGRADLWRQALRRRVYLRRAGLLGGLREAEGRASHQHENARVDELIMRSKADQAKGRINEKEEAYQGRRQVLRETGARAAALQKEVAELEESARAMASVIDAIERKRRAAAGAKEPVRRAPVPLHSLPWPVEGRVTQRFGKTQVPGLGTWTFHNGISIETAPGTRVRAVAAGKVIFAGTFRSYGNVLIVDHDAGFYGIYGHLEQSSARVGERVAAGADIASSSGEEGGVYFEVRQGQMPLDPLTVLTVQ
ncbi:MAG: permease-like cell division protein FtsX [Elusimicrobiota bacterium]|jgi:septal ring factor EnvC (AmiA/AmiB activator)